MPPKRAKSGTHSAAGHRWEHALLSAPFAEEDKWTASVHLVVGNRVEDYTHINHLVSAINSGSRRKFSVVTKEQLFEQVDDLGNAKNKKGKEAPVFYEVCEACKPFIDSGDEIPVALLAKLLKFKLLELKSADISQREGEAQEGAEKSTEKGKKGDKGKDRAKSPPKGKAGKKSPDPSSPKTQSKLRKRGEEDADEKHIDDEPDDGPHHYVFIVGFQHPHLLTLLCDADIHVDSIIKVDSEDYGRFSVAEPDAEPESPPAAENKDEKTLAVERKKGKKFRKRSVGSPDVRKAAEEDAKTKRDKLRVELEVFWKDVLLLMRQAPDESKLHDVARLQYTVKESIIPQDTEDVSQEEKFCAAIYEDVACMVYNMLDAKRQWRSYLDSVKLIHVRGQAEQAGVLQTEGSVSPGGGPADDVEGADLTGVSPDVDMRCYNELMNSVPQECSSVPLIMHCMLEQVVATEEDTEPVSDASVLRTDASDDDLASHISAMAHKLGLSEEELQELLGSLPTRSSKGYRQPKLISYRDEMARRMHLLESAGDMDPWKAEITMLGESPLAEKLKVPHISAKTAQERAAQLQELMNFCATGGTTHAEIDHALKQLLLESMELTEVNATGEVVPATLPPALIPWDSPYFYFKGITVADETELEEDRPPSVVRVVDTEAEDKDNGSRPSTAQSHTPGDSGRASPAQDPVSPAPPQTGILKSPSTAGCHQGSLSRNSSVHFEMDSEGRPLPQPGDEDDDDKVAPPAAGSSPPPARSVDENMRDLVKMKKRDLDQWCFSEHLEPAVFLQVLHEALYSHPYLDVYRLRRDRSMFLALSSPHNAARRRTEAWTRWLHSNCGFRNYLEHVARHVEDWARDEDAAYRAALLAREVETLRHEADEAGSAPGSPQGRSSSGGSSRDHSPGRNPFVRAGTLKAMKEELERHKAEDEEKEKEKKPKSPEKSRSARDVKKRKSSRAMSVDEKAVEEAPVEPIETEKVFPFTGYDVGNMMAHVSGTTTSLFPADGAEIRAEKTQFVQGEAVVKVTVLKDGHQFVVHVVDPKHDPFAELAAAQESTEAAEPVVEQNVVKDECKDTEGEINVESAPEVPHSDPQEDKPTKPCVGHFGSFVGQFCDGLSVSLSTYGASGVPVNGEPYVPEAYTAPVVRTPSPVAVAKSKSKEKEKDKEKSKAALVATPDPAEEELDEVLKEEEAVEAPPVEQPFQQLHLTCPDGLKVSYALESSLDIIPEDPEQRKLVVKQSYPFRTGGRQTTDNARRQAHQETSRTVRSDGTVVKFMEDRSVVVLYADGKVSVLNDISAHDAGAARRDSPQRDGAKSAQIEATAPTPTAKESKEGKESRQQKTVANAGEEKKKDKTKSVAAVKVSIEEKVEVAPPVASGEWLTTLPSGERCLWRVDGTRLPAPRDLVVCTASDPLSKQVMYTREDQVVTVRHPDGAVIVEHADGTRITSYSRHVNMGLAHSRETGEETQQDTKLVNFVVVECPGYATLKFDSDTTECSTEFGTGTTIHAFPVGNYDVYHCDGGYLQIDAEGRTVYFPRPSYHLLENDPNHHLMYSMCHFSDVVLDVTDHDGNRFSVSNTGTCLVQRRDEGGDALLQGQSEEVLVNAEQNRDETEMLEEGQEKGEMDRSENEKNSQGDVEEDQPRDPVEYKAHAPRFFVVHADGSATELLRYQDVAEYLTQAEEDLSTAILVDPLADYPGVTGLTVLKPYLKNHSDRWLMNYAQTSIIPEGLTSRDLKTLPAREMKKEGPTFGTNVGQGLRVGSATNRGAPVALTCPDKLELRQLIQHQPVTQELKDKLEARMRNYAEFLAARAEDTAALLVRDPRSDEERTHAADLQAKARTAQAPPVGFIEDNRPASRLQGDVKTLYEEATLPVKTEGPTTPKSKRSAAAVERDRREVEEELENRAALRDHAVPGYFDSELGQAYLVSQTVLHNAVCVMWAEAVADAERETTRDSLDAHDAPASPAPEAADSATLLYAAEQSVSEPLLTLQVPEDSDRPISDTPPPTGGALTGSGARLQPLGYSSPPPQRDSGGSDDGNSPHRPWNPTPAHAVGYESPVAAGSVDPSPAASYTQPTDRAGQPTSIEMNRAKLQPAVTSNFASRAQQEELQHSSEAEEALDGRARVLETNVVGERRGYPVRLPQYLYSSKPGAFPNTKFEYTEEPVRRKVFTSSVASAQLKTSRNLRSLRGFELLPDRVNFGILQEGSTYGYTVHLKNMGIDTCRFKITQPPPSTGIKVFYKFGPVAAGMKVELQIEIYAIAVGVTGESGVGVVSHNLEIVTETDHLFLPITATVLTAQDYARYQVSERPVGKSPGVYFLSNKPPSGQGSIRPQRIYATGSES